MDQQSFSNGIKGEYFAVNIFRNKVGIVSERIDDYLKRTGKRINDRSPEENHKQGDIYIIKPLNNGLYDDQKIARLLDIKTSIFNMPTINLDDDNHTMSCKEFFDGVYHHYYLGIANFNNNPYDINQNTTYYLIKTSEVLNAILDSKNGYLERPKENEQVKGLRYKSRKTNKPNPDFAYFDSFENFCPSYFKTNDINKILEKII